ncbi:MAG TPA: hypothetical protein VK478_02610 [Gemmatimonadaceae bacterium]|nr:hypothetical protein [Gemmatimonadaceae bacterium]
MDIQIVAQFESRTYAIGWIGLQPDKSISVGLNDRAFMSPRFHSRIDLWNADNRVTVEYLVPDSLAQLSEVLNPHLTYHPPITFHLRETNGEMLFEAIADVGVILEEDQQMPWIRFVSRPVADMRETAGPRKSGNKRIITIHLSSREGSVGLSVDFVKPGTAITAGHLVDYRADWGAVGLNIYAQLLPAQRATLAWYHQF